MLFEMQIHNVLQDRLLLQFHCLSSACLTAPFSRALTHQNTIACSVCNELRKNQSWNKKNQTKQKPGGFQLDVTSSILFQDYTHIHTSSTMLHQVAATVAAVLRGPHMKVGSEKSVRGTPSPWWLRPPPAGLDMMNQQCVVQGGIHSLCKLYDEGSMISRHSSASAETLYSVICHRKVKVEWEPWTKDVFYTSLPPENPFWLPLNKTLLI